MSQAILPTKQEILMRDETKTVVCGENTYSRRISAELTGDSAVEADVLETALRIADVARTKGERDTALITLAMMALSREKARFTSETGKRYPSYQELLDHIKLP
jgi:hypothetical protein